MGKKYKFNIGDIVKNEKQHFEILDQAIRTYGKSNTHKAYKTKCLDCGYVEIKTEGNILQAKGCMACNGKVVIKDINSIWKTHPEYVKYFVDINDSYTHTYSSSKKIKTKCPDCGHEKKMYVFNLTRQSYGCPACSDGISYPEKFLLNVLNQTGTSFEYQKVFDWSLKGNSNNLDKNKRYDFYLNDYNIILECHGSQHYNAQNGFMSTLSEIVINDKLKKDLAIENKIKSYIELDCSVSTKDFIKNSIKTSELSSILNLSKIEWELCDSIATNSMVIKACKMWNDGMKSTTDIAKCLSLSKDGVLIYLKKGVKLGICNYTKEESNKEKGSKISKNSSSKVKVVCLNTGEVFEKSSDANKKYKTNLSKVLSGKAVTSGKLEDGTKLCWVRFDEYIKLNNEDIKKFISDDYIKSKYKKLHNKKKVVCLNTSEVFDSLADAHNCYPSTDRNSISLCCNGKNSYSGHDDLGNKLLWIYYSDYINLSEEKLEIHKQQLLTRNKGGNHKKSKSVICLTTMEIFPSIADAKLKYNSKEISACCRGRRISDGELDDGTKLVWMYYTDYLESSKEELDIKLQRVKKVASGSSHGKSKSVICLTTSEIFNCIQQAKDKYGSKDISSCCKGKRNYSGKLPDGTPLKWMYYDEYLKQI